MTAAAEVREDDAFVRLAAAMPLHADPDAVAALLTAPPAGWPGEPVWDVRHGMRRYAVDLRLRVGGARAGLTTFSKAAYLDLATPRRTASGWVVNVDWRASTAAPLFPVFSGLLTIGPDHLRVDGLYAPPGGVVGRAADRLLFHLAANATARWLLGEIDRAALGAAG